MPTTSANDGKHPATPASVATNPRGRISQRQVPMYALISLGVFACCAAVLFVLIANAEKLSRYGLLQQIYYLVLVLMGLTAAGFLFGVLQSTATYTGELWGRSLQLSGSAIGAALVVIGGYYFLPTATTFPLTIYVHGEDGPQDIVLRNSGRVVLKLGPAPQSQPIGENGQAFFPAIPSDFQGQQVQAWVESDTYESSNIPATIEGKSIDLQVKKKIKHFEIAGTVSDAKGNPVAGVHVVLQEFNVANDTNEYGRFEIEVAADGQQRAKLMAERQGYQTAHLNPTLGDTGVNVQLVRNR